MTISRLPWRKCKRCHADIWKGMNYHKQRRGKVICNDCNKPKQVKGFITWLIGKLK